MCRQHVISLGDGMAMKWNWSPVMSTGDGEDGRQFVASHVHVRASLATSYLSSACRYVFV